MARNDVVNEDRIDGMLRGLLDDSGAPHGWAAGQRARLLDRIDGRSDRGRSDDAATPADFVELSRGEISRRPWRFIGATAAAALVIGGIAVVPHRDPNPGIGASAAETSANQDGAVAPSGEMSLWPQLLPALTPADGEQLEVDVGRLYASDPPETTSIVARVDGTSASDLMVVTAVDRERFEATAAGVYGTPTSARIGGTDVSIYTYSGVELWGTVLVPGIDGLAVMVKGADPVAFVEQAGVTFASATRDGLRSADVGPRLSISRLPSGYQTLVEPETLPSAGRRLPSIGIVGSGGFARRIVNVVPGSLAWTTMAGAADTTVTALDNGRWWITTAQGDSQLIWRVGDSDWAEVIFQKQATGSVATLDELRAVADRVELVDLDTWQTRYPAAVAQAEGPAATTTVPATTTASSSTSTPVSAASARVFVANASTVNGAASKLTRALSDTYQLLKATNATMPLERSVVYFQPGSENWANQIANRIGGADVLPMPDLPQIEGVDKTGMSADLADVLADVDVLVMLGNDHAPDFTPDAPSSPTTMSSSG